MSQVITATLAVTFRGGKSGKNASFDCPSCAARVTYNNTFPLGFTWKVCKKCRLLWTLLSDLNLDVHLPSEPPPQPGTQLGMIRVASDGVPVTR